MALNSLSLFWALAVSVQPVHNNNKVTITVFLYNIAFSVGFDIFINYGAKIRFLFDSRQRIGFFLSKYTLNISNVSQSVVPLQQKIKNKRP